MPVLKNQRFELIAQHMADGKADHEACLAAGYSESTARTQSTRMVTRPEIQSRIVEIMEMRATATLVDARKLHQRWSEMFDADIADIMDEQGHYKPVQQWPKIWRQMLSGCDVKELFERSKDGEGASWDKIGEVVKLKFVSVKELGELLGRHKAVDAFVQQKAEEHLHLHLHAELNNRIAAGRQRAAQRNAVTATTETTKVAS